MSISYKPLLKLLIDRDIKKTHLQKAIGISSVTMAKFSKGESVGADIIEKICLYLHCQPSDIFEVVEDKEE